MSQPPNGWHGPERRTNLRLRAVIDELQTAVRENRASIDTLTQHVDDIRKEVAGLKGRPATPHE